MFDVDGRMEGPMFKQLLPAEESAVETRPLDVVAVGAHPDDVEVACGGTLAQMARQGYRVGIIDLTDGEPSPCSSGPDERLAEAVEAARVLGVQYRVVLELPNRRLFDSFEARVALACEFRRLRPRVVLGFGDKTPTASPDHWQAMQITDAAVFYSRLTKWDEQFAGRPPHVVDHQLYFRLPFEPSTLPGYHSHVTTDISETLEIKLQSIACYNTQFPPAKHHVFDRVRGAALIAGGACGYHAGETFVHTRGLGTPDLMRTLFPPADHRGPRPPF
jgi:LmbE family N-acetylglucosaminyl deacetylase